MAIELVVDIPFDKACLSHPAVAQQNNLEAFPGDYGTTY
jgi:hypothetical protein